MSEEKTVAEILPRHRDYLRTCEASNSSNQRPNPDVTLTEKANGGVHRFLAGRTRGIARKTFFRLQRSRRVDGMATL